MGMLGGLLGIWLFFQKELLIGEVLSHSIFPGMIIGSVIATMIGAKYIDGSFDMELICLSVGGAISAYFSILLMRFLIVRRFATQDGALSIILSSTFGIGLLAISLLQTTYPALWRKLMSLLMGQAATIPNHYISISCTIFLFIFFAAIVLRRSFFSYLFDKQFSKIHRLMRGRIQQATIITVIVVALLGVRIMGVVLLSAMLTFPPITARFFSDRAGVVTSLSMMFGGIACGIGVLLSHELSISIRGDMGRPIWLPTGPLVVLVMTSFFLFSLLFAPRHGIVMKGLRRLVFHWRCTQENLIKFLWKASMLEKSEYITDQYLLIHSPISPKSLLGRLHFYFLQRTGYVERGDGYVYLLSKSLYEGKKLVRLHRLWELYLVEYCGMNRDAVHPSAEEMEHILTPEMERELVCILHNPTVDPHKQPIPDIEAESSRVR